VTGKNSSPFHFPPSSFRRKPESSLRLPKLDPDFRQGDEQELSRSNVSIVIPANAGIQLRRSKLDPDFRQGDE
jgi:hypothetical protein